MGCLQLVEGLSRAYASREREREHTCIYLFVKLDFFTALPCYTLLRVVYNI